MEGKMDPVNYLLQLISWGLEGLFKDMGQSHQGSGPRCNARVTKGARLLTQRNLKKIHIKHWLWAC